jgi:hypothetical protein
MTFLTVLMQYSRRQISVPAAVALTLVSSFSAFGTNELQFNRDVRPILTENCYACHGPDKNQRKAKLRLDVREVAIEREAIVPGKPQQSKVVEHIFSTDPDEIMPPPKTGKTLTAAQKETLKNWITAGAEYEPHWAYIPLKKPEVPQTKNAAWVNNPIDAFILHTLESKKLEPSPEADKRTLLRRLSLDLIGLPPTTEEIQAFLADTSPAAYERQVERLLNSPHFGERMAVPWLDLVRFADTVGYHGDQNQDVFPYRDYVIGSFNRNKPFDAFTLEQLAGDLLEGHPSTEAQVATCFNRLNMMTREGGAQPKEYLAKYAADRVRTVSMAWLGSTMGCAECHDHKYDPFSTKDFYQMEAFFADIKQWGVYMDYDYTPNPDLKGWSNDHPFPPEIEVDSPYLKRRLAKLQALTDETCEQMSMKLKADRQKRKAFEQWRKESLAFLKRWPSGWATLQPEVALRMKETNAVAETNFTVEADNAVRFGDGVKESTKLTLPLSNCWVGALRLEIVPQEVKEAKSARLKKRNGTAITLAATLRTKDGKETKVPFYFAEADHKQERYANGFAIIGVKDLWQISIDHGEQTGVWLLEKPIEAKAGDVLVVNLGNLAVSSAKISITPFVAQEPLECGIGSRLQKALAARWRPTPAQIRLVSETYLLSTHSDANAVAGLRKAQNQIRECRHGRAPVMVAQAREPLITRVLPRGNWQDESGEIVQPGVPHFLPEIPSPDGHRLTRLDLARWLVVPENPLTSRAVMNRLWKQFFGTGISAVVDDLGAQGEWPVHPELLDWLACEFMNPATKAESRKQKVESGGNGDLGLPEHPHGWDFKHMVRLMVMSSTYRQSSNQRPELKELDPNNRLLAGQTPRRLEAEFVRDNALFIAGLLNKDMGGPSAHPYQPAGYYANLQFPDRDYFPEKDERQYRRGIYSHRQRTFLQPMLANFDAPSREECTANRIVSNTPQQALTLLNDPTFVEASRAFAASVLAAATSSDEQRLDFAFERALNRPATDKEKQSLLSFLTAQKEYYGPNSDEAAKLIRIGNSSAPKNADASELAAWTQVCRVILNLHETITRY